MHALLVMVTIEPGATDKAQASLESDILPRVKQMPGVISGVWTRSDDGTRGASYVLFDSEGNARAAEAAVGGMPAPEFVTFDTVEVRGVVAQV